MTIRNIAIAFAIGAASLSTAHAADPNTGGWKFVGGEIGYVAAPATSVLARSQVQQQLLAFKADPRTADGGRIVGGQIGYEAASHAYALRNGKLECVDNIAHNAPPEAVKSPADQARFQELYPA